MDVDHHLVEVRDIREGVEKRQYGLLLVFGDDVLLDVSAMHLDVPRGVGERGGNRVRLVAVLELEDCGFHGHGCLLVLGC